MWRKSCHALGLTLAGVITLSWLGCGQSEDSSVGPTTHGPKTVSKTPGDAAVDEGKTGRDGSAPKDEASESEPPDASFDGSPRDVSHDVTADGLLRDVASDSVTRDAPLESGGPVDSAVVPETGADAGNGGAPDAGSTCSGLTSPTPSVFPGDVYVTRVRINSGGSVATFISPGADFSVEYDFKIQSEPGCYCPGCVQQVYVGFPGQAPPSCVSVSRGCPGTSQTNQSVTLRAPATPGTYYLSVGSSLDYTCTGAPVADPNAYVGVICVR